MAITAYTGPPGAGKSHALVKDVILSAVMAGRRVVSNIDGLSPNAILAYCLERENQWQVDEASKLGEVVLFHGEDSKKAGFWPDEQTEAQKLETFVKPGDLVVLDEYAMFYPPGEKPSPEMNLEAFMRWHRHLTHPVTGAATDLAIATQSITDLHRRHRPLLSRSYLFKKLTSVGASNAYTWHAFDGRLQRQSYQTGTAKYDPAVFPLYKSSAAAGAGNHTELKTNKKETIWSGWRAWAIIIGAPLLMVAGMFFLYRSYSQFSDPTLGKAAVAGENVPAGATGPVNGIPAPTQEQPSSPWRIVGQVQGEAGTRVIVADDKGGVRMLKPDDFEFDEGRPVSGRVDGQLAVAVDRLPSGQTNESVFGGALQ